MRANGDAKSYPVHFNGLNENAVDAASFEYLNIRFYERSNSVLNKIFPTLYASELYTLTDKLIETKIKLLNYFRCYVHFRDFLLPLPPLLAKKRFR